MILGEQYVKNIARPVRVYRVRAGGPGIIAAARDSCNLLDCFILGPPQQPIMTASPRLDPAILAKIPRQASDWRVMRAESQVRTPLEQDSEVDPVCETAGAAC